MVAFDIAYELRFQSVLQIYKYIEYVKSVAWNYLMSICNVYTVRPQTLMSYNVT